MIVDAMDYCTYVLLCDSHRRPVMHATNGVSKLSRYGVIAKIVNFQIFDLENEGIGRRRFG